MKTAIGVFLLIGILWGALFTMGKEQPQKVTGGESDFKNGGRLRLLSSSHQDIAWMDSPQKCVVYRDEHCITPALEMMARNPDYCFVMENMLNLMEYLERHPDRKADIQRYTKEGRLEWGATFNQPYESLLSGEQLVREVYFGRRWIKKNLPGCDAAVYFNPDVPGRALQMQQILSKSGVRYMVISRYHEGFYDWASPDGSKVLAYSPGHYSNTSALLNAKPEQGVKAIAEKLAAWTPYYRQRGLPPEFPLLHSEDFSKPTDYGPLIGLWNDSHRTAAGVPAPKMQYSSTADFFRALDGAQSSFDRVMGERPNLWLYIHGPTHHEAISAQREAGFLLPAAEKFQTVGALLAGGFKDYPVKSMEEAWQAAIYPDHGWGGKEGQITDRLFRKKYEFARDKGREMLMSALRAIAARVGTDPAKGRPVVVFNALSWTRSDPVTITIKRGPAPLTVQDARGKVAPCQILPSLPDQSPDEIRYEFIAEDVPPIGYKTFYLTEHLNLGPVRPQGARSGGAVENSFYRIELVPGGVKNIFDKELGLEILNTRKFLGFEIFTMQSIGSGAGEFGRVQQPTMEGFDKLSAHGTPWTFEAGESGPIKTVFGMTQRLPDCTVREKLILYHAIKRIDCEIDLVDWDGSPYREYRLALPAAATGGHVAYEVPMGVVEVGKDEAAGTGGPAYGSLVYDEPLSQIRPREVQNFMSVSDARLGLTMSTSVAVNDFQDPTSDPASSPVLQAVLLASRRSCHAEGNWYLQEGDHHYRFSVVSHPPGWRNGYRSAIQVNGPLFTILEPARETGAALPESKSFFSVSAPNVLISTIKKCEDDEAVIVRGYDIEGKGSGAQLEFFFPVEKAERVNMIEDEGKTIPSRRTALLWNVGPNAIETLKLYPVKTKSD
jgi:alpha-mannosidase